MAKELIDRVLKPLSGIVEAADEAVAVLDEARLRERAIDDLVHKAVFAEPAEAEAARWVIWELGQALGIQSTSTHDFYMARGRGEYGDLTVPAMNLRGMTYDMGRAVFRAALKHNVGAMIFEIARSEIGYTMQRPAEYTAVVTAAAIKEGFRGPLFMQGDHFQVNAKKYLTDPEGELGAVKDLIREAISGGFYNIDIDTSTLVDLSRPTLKEQQYLNYKLCADLSALIRQLEPEGVTISLGGEIGEVGGKNSTPEELVAFMEGYNETLAEHGQELISISKISVQTGTSHGGVVLPDGTLARVAIDFDVLERLSEMARREYGMGGAVQHGASTLPPQAFHKFVQVGTCEVHLATGFQNIIYEHEALPSDFRDKVYDYIKRAEIKEWKEGETEEQFIYKTRKKGFGPLKADWWGLDPDIRAKIGQSLEDQFAFLFEQLNVVETVDLVAKHVSPPTIHRPPPTGEAGGVEVEDVSGLAD